MPIIYSKPIVQTTIFPTPTTNPSGFPSRVADWLTNACDNYLRIDHWKTSNDGLYSTSRYGERVNAHINRMPVEILGEIFIHCLGEIDPARTGSSPTSLSPSPLADPQTLGEVCRFWRDVTLSTPSLWSKIWIYQPQRSQVRRVEMWLNRSREYPLNIRIIQLPGGVTHDNHAAADKILSLLVGQVHRWRRIHFRFGSTAQEPLLTLPVGAATNMESAYVDMWKWDQASADQFWKICFSSPSLRHADWVSYTKKPPNYVPWTQLTSITLYHGLTVEECMSILQGCRHLEALCIHAIWTYDSLVDPYGPLTLPSLRHLSFLGYVEGTAIFNRLTLPSLTSLEISNAHPHHHHERRSCMSFRNLLQRSACRLEKLRLFNTSISPSDLHNYLSTPQMLSLLELDLEAPVTNQTIHSLTLSDNPRQPHLLPNLEAISLNEICTSDGSISDMILSRLSPKSNTPLKSARLWLKAQTHIRDISVFQNIMENNNWVHVVVT
ncbi:hypothetical protein BDZ94DRAFT_1227394 [Collybia nuda]|uniref:F-box domain-containing protein n=1 Tax=Collybia nuda TaxID=64659 RepID=A0A9P6CA11_9AGAR|nr:hypothetical protein BDZ94DRAFT_1227394 [Collybia nuda]